MKLTEKQIVFYILCPLGILSGFFWIAVALTPVPPKAAKVEQPNPAPSVAVPTPMPSPPNRIKGKLIRTGEDFRYEIPASVEIGKDGTITVTASREYQFGNGINKSRFKFTFAPNGRWTEQEKTIDTTDGKTYPFTYDGSYSLTQVDGIAKISANFDDLPKAGLPPWIAVEFTTSEQLATIPPKLEAAPQAASPAEVEATNQITPDRNAPSGQAAELNGPDPDARIEVYDATIKPLHYGLPGDRVTILGNGTSPNGDLWHQVRFDQSGAEGWVSRRNINFVGMTREAPVEPQQQTHSAPSHASSGRCNSPDDTDSRGRRCGARAKKR